MEQPVRNAMGLAVPLAASNVRSISCSCDLDMILAHSLGTLNVNHDPGFVGQYGHCMVCELQGQDKPQRAEDEHGEQRTSGP